MLQALTISNDGSNEITNELALVENSNKRCEKTKRFFDIFLSSLLILATSPLLILITILLKTTSNGPALFKQSRVTKGGKIFKIIKFRTMIVDAEAKSGAVFAVKNDPRVTKLGNFMRRSRIDELPQLFNILMGDMSLVGPRPERPEFISELQSELPNFNKRHNVKAGLTGLAQVSAEYASCMTSYSTKLAYDLKYVEQQSLALDFKIFLRTFLVVLSGFGSR